MLPTIKPCTLNKALSYQNEDVVHRFTKLYDISFEEAQDIFLETKKWLWLTAQARSRGITTQLSIKDTLFIIDEMWHNFILFTDDYSRYCLDHFGYFIHHTPSKQSDRERRQRKLESNPDQVRQEQMQSLQRQCKFICEKLGADTLLKWFIDFPQRYTADFFNHHRKDVSLGWTPTPELQALAASVKAGRIVVTKAA